MSNLVSEQSEPARHWHVFHVALPANCQNPEYSIRKLLGSDHGGEMYINHEVHANLTLEEVKRLIELDCSDLKALITGPAAIKVGGVTPRPGIRTFWLQMRTFWNHFWTFDKKE